MSQFEDADSFNPSYQNDSLTFRDIMLQHLKKIASLSCVEFRGGYYEEKLQPVQGGSMRISVYVPDTREQYSNAVECLADMLYPHFDEDIIKEENEIKENIKKEYERCRKDVSYENQPDFKFSTFLKDGKEIFNEHKRKENQRLFRALCSFLKRKNYLDLGVMED